MEGCLYVWFAIFHVHLDQLLLADDHDRPFIVLTETKLSKRHIPVWARYSPLYSDSPGGPAREARIDQSF